jgi:hypothetical protein
MILRTTIICSSILFLSIGDRFATAADPSVMNPSPPVGIHGVTEEAKRLFADASKSDDAITTLYTQMKKGTVKPELVGKMSMHLSKLKRLCTRLIDLGEPAGIEFQRRNVRHEAELADAYTSLEQVPKIRAIREKATAVLKKNVPKRTKIAAQAVKQASQDAMSAEEGLEGPYDEFESVAGILPSTMRDEFMELQKAFAFVGGAASAQRKQLLFVAVDSLAAETSKDFDRFIASCKQATNTFAKGRTGWEDKDLSGSEMIDAMFQQGFVLQVKLQRMDALQILRGKGSVGGEGSSNVAGGSGQDLSSGARSKKVDQLKEVMSSTVVLVLEKESKNRSPIELVQQLEQYVAILGKYAHRIEGDEWIDLFDASILKLATQSQDATKDSSKLIENYQSATSELLMWHERFASAQAKILANGKPSLAETIRKASIDQVSQLGYFMANAIESSPPTFMRSTLEALPGIGKKLGNDTFVVASNVVRLDGESPVWMSKWENYIYGRFPNDFYKNDFSTVLKADCLVDSSKPALSVRAASAIYTAERGDGLTVGGVVNDVATESALTRIIALKETAAAFLGLQPPSDVNARLTMEHVSLRANVIPKWFRHRYFVSTK